MSFNYWNALEQEIFMKTKKYKVEYELGFYSFFFNFSEIFSRI